MCQPPPVHGQLKNVFVYIYMYTIYICVHLHWYTHKPIAFCPISYFIRINAATDWNVGFASLPDTWYVPSIYTQYWCHYCFPRRRAFVSFMFYEFFSSLRRFYYFVLILYLYLFLSSRRISVRGDSRETAFVNLREFWPGSFVTCFYGRFNRFQHKQIPSRREFDLGIK